MSTRKVTKTASQGAFGTEKQVKVHIFNNGDPDPTPVDCVLNFKVIPDLAHLLDFIHDAVQDKFAKKYNSNKGGGWDDTWTKPKKLFTMEGEEIKSIKGIKAGMKIVASSKLKFKSNTGTGKEAKKEVKKEIKNKVADAALGDLTKLNLYVNGAPKAGATKATLDKGRYKDQEMIHGFLEQKFVQMQKDNVDVVHKAAKLKKVYNEEGDEVDDLCSLVDGMTLYLSGGGAFSKETGSGKKKTSAPKAPDADKDKKYDAELGTLRKFVVYGNSIKGGKPLKVVLDTVRYKNWKMVFDFLDKEFTKVQKNSLDTGHKIAKLKKIYDENGKMVKEENYLEKLTSGSKIVLATVGEKFNKEAIGEE